MLFLLSFFSSIIRVRENTELEECTVTEFVVEKEEEEEVVIPEEEDDTWMLDIDQDDALLLAAACDNNGEHGMHSKYDCFRGPPEYIIHNFSLMSSKLTLFYIIFLNQTFYINVLNINIILQYF